MQLFRGGRTFPGRCRPASPRCTRSEACAGRSLGRCSSHWSQLWYWHDSTTTVRCWLVYLQGSWMDCSRFSTVLLYSSTRPRALNTCHRFFVSSTGFGSRGVLSSVLPCSLIVRCFNGTSPHYLADGLVQPSHSTSHRWFYQTAYIVEYDSLTTIGFYHYRFYRFTIRIYHAHTFPNLRTLISSLKAFFEFLWAVFTDSLH